MRDLVVEAPDVSLAVRDHGGEGPSLLMLHGLSSNVEIWTPVASRLRRRFRVVAFDQRSHGSSSDPDDHSFRSLAADVLTVAEATGCTDPVVVGHSWGASVALAYAGMYPDACRGVVCVDGGVIDLRGLGVEWEQAAELLRPSELQGAADELVARIRAEQDILPWDVLEPVVRRSFVSGPDAVMRRRTPVARHMRIVYRLWEQRLDAAYERVRCPVRVVLARGVERAPREQGFVAAKLMSAQRLAERHPWVQISWLDSVHDIPLLHPDELAEHIERFVDELEA